MTEGSALGGCWTELRELQPAGGETRCAVGSLDTLVEWKTEQEPLAQPYVLQDGEQPRAGA